MASSVIFGVYVAGGLPSPHTGEMDQNQLFLRVARLTPILEWTKVARRGRLRICGLLAAVMNAIRHLVTRQPAAIGLRHSRNGIPSTADRMVHRGFVAVNRPGFPYGWIATCWVWHGLISRPKPLFASCPYGRQPRVWGRLTSLDRFIGYHKRRYEAPYTTCPFPRGLFPIGGFDRVPISSIGSFSVTQRTGGIGF